MSTEFLLWLKNYVDRLCESRVPSIGADDRNVIWSVVNKGVCENIVRAHEICRESILKAAGGTKGTEGATEVSTETDNSDESEGGSQVPEIVSQSQRGKVGGTKGKSQKVNIYRTHTGSQEKETSGTNSESQENKVSQKEEGKGTVQPTKRKKKGQGSRKKVKKSKPNTDPDGVLWVYKGYLREEKEAESLKYRFTWLIKQVLNGTVTDVSLDDLGLLLCYSQISNILGVENHKSLLDDIYAGDRTSVTASSSSSSSTSSSSSSTE